MDEPNTAPTSPIQRLGDMMELMKSNADISHKLDMHILADAQVGEMTKTMYKVLVTGNGVPSLQERVRELERWIANERKLMVFIGAIIATDIVARFWNLIVMLK